MKAYITQNNKIQIVSICFILLVWQVLAVLASNEIKLPTPISTISSLFEIVTSNNFFINIAGTLKRVLISFIISFILGTSLGILAGFYERFFYFLKPIVIILKSTPTIAVILLSLIWLGREISPILVGFLIVFPLIYSTVVTSISNIDKTLIEMVTVYNFSTIKRFKHLYLPSIWSNLSSIAVSTVGLSIKVCIAAEVLSQPKYGIGSGFQLEKVALNTGGLIAWSIIAVLLAELFEHILSYFFKKIT
ncbi:MAG: ABC transporter permease [Lachnospirales bacterium]